MIGGLWKSTSRVALLAAAGLMMGSLATTAQAADLGGDCCADLEERVAELEATTARKGNRKVSLTVSGFVNEMVMFWDNGDESNAYVVTNGHAPSRFRFVGEAKITSDVSAGYYMEFQATGAASNSVTAFDDDNGFGISLRQSNWYLKSNTLGTLRVGQLSPATDDLILGTPANLGHASTSDIGLTGGGLVFGGTAVSINSLLPTLDTSRRNAVRYDTPTFQGFRLAAAWGEDDFWDVALWMANTWGDFKVVFNIGYLEDTEGNGLGSVFALNAAGFCCQGANFQEFKGSGGIMHVPTGLFADAAFVHREFDSTLGSGAVVNRADFDYWHVRAGIEGKWTPLGRTTIFGQYANGQDANVVVGSGNSQDIDVWGAGINQEISAAAMDLYLVYKNFDAGLAVGGVAVQSDDVDVVYTGAIIRF
ncbi:MAG: porin [Pseudomonadota bacterium]